MNAASALVCVLFSVQGWQTHDLAEGGISLLSPAPFRLTASGADADTPQSVERSLWRTVGGDLDILVTYERWKSPQFNPDKSLEIFIRRVTGVSSGFTIQPKPLGGLAGSTLLLGSPESPERAIFRAKSGSESWQVDVRPRAGALDPGDLDKIASSILISAQPQSIATDAWGNIIARVEPPVQPRPAPQAPSKLASARIRLLVPFEVQEKKEGRTSTEKSGFQSLVEWEGRGREGEAAVTYLRLKPGQSVDLVAWVAACGEALRREGILGFEPDIQDFNVPGAKARLIRGEGEKQGRRLSLQMILIVRGQEAWAVQTRLHPDSAKLHQSVSSSIQLDPPR